MAKKIYCGLSLDGRWLQIETSKNPFIEEDFSNSLIALVGKDANNLLEIVSLHRTLDQAQNKLRNFDKYNNSIFIEFQFVKMVNFESNMV